MATTRFMTPRAEMVTTHVSKAPSVQPLTPTRPSTSTTACTRLRSHITTRFATLKDFMLSSLYPPETGIALQAVQDRLERLLCRCGHRSGGCFDFLPDAHLPGQVAQGKERLVDGPLVDSHSNEGLQRLPPHLKGP